MMLGQKSEKIKKQEMKIRDVEKVFEDAGKFYVCDFGHRHFLNQKCFCHEKYGEIGIIFKSKLKELGFKVWMNSDITTEMQNEFLKQKQN